MAVSGAFSSEEASEESEFSASRGTICWDCRWGAELGSHAPRIHVETPKRGSIQI